jgi:hypothetical protein
MARFGTDRPTRGVNVGDLLLACLKPDAVDDAARMAALLEQVDAAVICDAARYHRVVAPVHEAVRRVDGVDKAVVRGLAALRREAAVASFRVIRALHQVRDALDAAGLRWVVVKGPVLSDIVYSQRGIRTYHDLDALVQPADFKAALETLEHTGFRLADPNWKFHRRWVAGELRLRLEGGADVDLHWHLVFSRQIRRSFRLPIADLVARAREVSVHGVSILTLDAADALLHLTVHACREGGDRLFWLKDIEQSVVNDKPDWDEVVARAHEWRVHLLVGTMLLRTRAALAAPVPEEVVRALLPDAWRIAAAAADRLFPPERSSARGTPATLLAHGARDTVGSSASAIASEVVRMVRQLIGGEPWRQEEWDRGRGALENPSDPNSKLFATGDARDRAWLLDELVRETASV